MCPSDTEREGNMSVLIIHRPGQRAIAYNVQGKEVLGTGYFTGKQKPNYPMPAPIVGVEYFMEQSKCIAVGMYEWRGDIAQCVMHSGDN